MGEFWGRLFDHSDFMPRRGCGAWTEGLVWLHVGSDLMIWLAYLSIPLLLLYLTRRKVPFNGLFALAAGFIVFCGFTHFVDALMFTTPVYRFAGVLKAATAAISWAMVFALVPTIPRVTALLVTGGAVRPGLAGGTASHTPLLPGRRGDWARGYIIALLAGTLAVLVRALLDPVLLNDRAYVLALLAVVYVGWQCGFGPAVVTLVVGLSGMLALFVVPRMTPETTFSDLLAAGLFFFCGVACAALGGSQRGANARARAALADAVERRTEAEAEVARRRAVEADLRASEGRFRAVVEAALDCIIAIDRRGRVVEFNPAAERTFGYSRADVMGKELAGLVVPPAHRAAHAGGLARFLATGEARVLNRRLTGLPAVRKDGTEFPTELTIVPMGPADDPVFVAYLRDITDRLAAEAELRANEERFRQLAETIPNLAWMAKADGHIFWYNRRWYEYSGTTPEQMEGWGWQAVHDPAVLPEVVDRWKRTLATGEPFNMVFPLKGADGVFRPFLTLINPFRDAAGRILFWFGTNTDISEQKRAEADLEGKVAERTADLNREREFLRAVLENIEDAVVACDAGGKLTLFNRATLTLHGLPAEPIPAEEWAAYYRLLAADGVTPLAPAEVPLYRALNGEHVRNAEMVVAPAGSGSPRALLASGQPIFDDAGRKLGAVVSMHDVTDRLAAEAARVEVVRQQAARAEVERSAARFRSLTEAVPQMVWTADPAGTVTYFNRRWTEYTGLAVAEMTGDRAAGLIHPDDAPGLDASWKAAVAGTEGRYAYEFRLRRQADGEYRWMLSNAVALPNEAGAAAEWVGTLTDIDDQKRQTELLERLVRERTAELVSEIEERRRAEDQVRAVAQELQRSNGELEQFAYVASHDLQEPLRKIQAFGDLLGTKYAAQLPDQGREYVGKMQGSAGRMSRLIDDLLTFSRVTTHARPFARVDLNVIAAEVVDDLEVRIDKTGATVDIGPLPAVDADPTQMRQVFQNLLGNALKFGRPGVPRVVTVRGEVVAGADGRSGGWCRLTVADNGIGFEDRHKDRIFQVFQRLHGREDYDGTGVGLAVCKKIVDRHGGTITARGVPGVGATFEVVLPARHPEPPAAATPPPGGSWY